MGQALASCRLAAHLYTTLRVRAPSPFDIIFVRIEYQDITARAARWLIYSYTHFPFLVGSLSLSPELSMRDMTM